MLEIKVSFYNTEEERNDAILLYSYEDLGTWMVDMWDIVVINGLEVSYAK